MLMLPAFRSDSRVRLVAACAPREASRRAFQAEFGGRGGDYRAMALTLETLADAGGCQGVAISWMSQVLNARLHILGQGSDAQKHQYLPGLAAGRHTVCMAISEPGAGAVFVVVGAAVLSCARWGP